MYLEIYTEVCLSDNFLIENDSHLYIVTSSERTDSEVS